MAELIALLGLRAEHVAVEVNRDLVRVNEQQREVIAALTARLKDHGIQ